MSKLLFFLSLAFAAVSCSNESSTKSTTTPRSPLDRWVDTTLSAYNQLNEAFVNWDSSSIPAKANALQLQIAATEPDSASLSAGEKQKLATARRHFHQMSASLDKLQTPGDLTSQRMIYHDVSNHFFAAVKSLQYTSGPIYLQECTMPYSDTGRGVWVSRSKELEERRNPYLGTSHPRYKDGMLHCGSVAETYEPGKN